MVWVLDPRTGEVMVYASNGEVKRLTAEDELDGGEVLPGLRLRVADLFEG